MLREATEPFRGYQEHSEDSRKIEQQAADASRDQANHSMLQPSLDRSFFASQGRAGSAQPGQRPEQLAKGSSSMNTKVMETWINETLADAEHLNIPGVILKPEHKNPISRYCIDRLTLTNSGIPNDTVDRVYRSLFVYSVGFYELIKQLVAHCQKKYSIITSIWIVFSVLLEYCCQSDYRMLISEITNQHEEEIEIMQKDFQA